MKKELVKNNITITVEDYVNNFFAVEKLGLSGVISFDNFEEDLNDFIISVELFGMKTTYDVNYINSNEFDFSKISENQIRDLMLDGFEPNSLLVLDIKELDSLYGKYN